MSKALPVRTRLIFATMLLSAIVCIAVAPVVFDAARNSGAWQATEELLSVTQAPRATDYPGVTAWLQLLLRERCKVEPGLAARESCEEILRPSKSIPSSMVTLQKYLDLATPQKVDIALIEQSKSGRLCVSEYRAGVHRYVTTVPLSSNSCQGRNAAPDEFIRWAVNQLEARSVPEQMMLAPFGQVAALRSYVMRQDGTLVSRRFSDDGRLDPSAGHEYQEFAHTADDSGSPALGSVNSFFPLVHSSKGFAYTGAYIDVTDFGVVATGLTLSRWRDEDAILAVDVAIGTEWISDMSSDQPQLTSLELDGVASWKSVAEKAARDDQLKELADLASNCAEGARPFYPVTTCGLPSDKGMVAAVRVGSVRSSVTASPNATWLIAWMPEQGAPRAVLAILPGVILLIAALGYLAVERQRRKTDEAARLSLQRKEEQITDWQKLADSIDAALVTIDPNTDRVRYLNSKARSFGIVEEQVFREFVVEEDRTAYDQFNSVTGDSKRAYAVRVEVRGETVRPWAVIRSKTFDKSLQGLNARENDRLGIITLLSDEEARRVFASQESKAISAERSKLTSLMNHGMASLAKVIPTHPNSKIRLVLHLFMARRIEALASILAGWDRPLEDVRRDEVAVSKEAIEGVLNHLRTLSEHVARDRNLRQELAWGNGVLSALNDGGMPFFMDFSQWPSDLQLTSLVPGAEYFVFEEFLVNAFKYGKPSSTPMLVARVVRDADRRWVEFTLRNEIRSAADVTLAPEGGRYGGRLLAAEACRRLRWMLAEPELKGSYYEVRWRARCIETKSERRR